MILDKYHKQCAQCKMNVLAWMSHMDLIPPDGVKFTAVYPDRVFLSRSKYIEDRISLHQESFIECYAKNHGHSVITGFRENVGKCAAQVIIHIHEIEIDFDYWHPYDLVGLAGHAWEVLSNRIGKKKTDPFKIKEQLIKRGIYGRKDDSDAG